MQDSHSCDWGSNPHRSTFDLFSRYQLSNNYNIFHHLSFNLKCKHGCSSVSSSPSLDELSAGEEIRVFAGLSSCVGANPCFQRAGKQFCRSMEWFFVFQQTLESWKIKKVDVADVFVIMDNGINIWWGNVWQVLTITFLSISEEF